MSKTKRTHINLVGGSSVASSPSRKRKLGSRGRAAGSRADKSSVTKTRGSARSSR